MSLKDAMNQQIQNSDSSVDQNEVTQLKYRTRLYSKHQHNKLYHNRAVVYKKETVNCRPSWIYKRQLSKKQINHKLYTVKPTATQHEYKIVDSRSTFNKLNGQQLLKQNSQSSSLYKQSNMNNNQKDLNNGQEQQDNNKKYIIKLFPVWSYIGVMTLTLGFNNLCNALPDSVTFIALLMHLVNALLVWLITVSPSPQNSNNPTTKPQNGNNHHLAIYFIINKYISIMSNINGNSYHNNQYNNQDWSTILLSNGSVMRELGVCSLLYFGYCLGMGSIICRQRGRMNVQASVGKFGITIVVASVAGIIIPTAENKVGVIVWQIAILALYFCVCLILQRFINIFLHRQFLKIHGNLIKFSSLPLSSLSPLLFPVLHLISSILPLLTLSIFLILFGTPLIPLFSNLHILILWLLCALFINRYNRPWLRTRYTNAIIIYVLLYVSEYAKILLLETDGNGQNNKIEIGFCFHACNAVCLVFSLAVLALQQHYLNQQNYSISLISAYLLLPRPDYNSLLVITTETASRRIVDPLLGQSHSYLSLVLQFIALTELLLAYMFYSYQHVYMGSRINNRNSDDYKYGDGAELSGCWSATMGYLLIGGTLWAGFAITRRVWQKVGTISNGSDVKINVKNDMYRKQTIILKNSTAGLLILCWLLLFSSNFINYLKYTPFALIIPHNTKISAYYMLFNQVHSCPSSLLLSQLTLFQYQLPITLLLICVSTYIIASLHLSIINLNTNKSIIKSMRPVLKFLSTALLYCCSILYLYQWQCTTTIQWAIIIICGCVIVVLYSLQTH